jgi:cytochrome c-type biogenesis protein CcmH
MSIASMKLSRTLALLSAALVAVVISLDPPSPAWGQGQAMNHGDRTGLIGARTDAERQAFSALACRCGGCPNEALITCPCAYADGYRNDIRAMIARGMTLEDIKKEWEKRFGADALTAPPNSGGTRALYVVPPILIVAFAGFVVMVLRRFRRRDEEKSHAAAAAGGAPLSSGEHDEYDDKLDDELKQLDRDE